MATAQQQVAVRATASGSSQKSLSAAQPLTCLTTCTFPTAGGHCAHCFDLLLLLLR